MAYCLRITDVDPLQFDLLFERFLNPERISLPDIDIDFCERRRGEVIEYVTRKYGRENVAQIITFGTMKAKAVVRDVGRVMDMSYADVDQRGQADPGRARHDARQGRSRRTPRSGRWRRTTRASPNCSASRKRLEGMARHASVHAAGVVIAPRPITEFAPLYKGSRDEITTQWGMKEIERIGLLKMDFLGLSTLTLIHDALAQIAATTGTRLVMEDLPLTDPKTFDLFCEGQTLGIFQFESSGMRQILRQAKPRKFEDLIALNALYRPGPIKGGMIDDFINRKHGRVEVRYELAQLRPILEDTYGVMAYQEQVMRVASELAGFTLGEADLLRKAMGKKNPALMQAQREKFVAGAAGRGISGKKAARVFDLMEQFAGYGFNKSHSTAYALLAYHTAYLKANYPWHFMAALLTIESQNTAKVATYLHECRELRVPILPPDVNSSELAFTVRPEGVRFGLGAVKNVGEGGHRVDPAGPRGAPGASRRSSASARRSTSAWSTSGCSRASSRAGRWTRWRPADPARRPRPRRSGRGCSPPWTAPSTTATATSAIGTRARHSCSAAATGTETRRPTPRSRRRPPGPTRSSWPSRRRRSGST